MEGDREQAAEHFVPTAPLEAQSNGIGVVHSPATLENNTARADILRLGGRLMSCGVGQREAQRKADILGPPS